MYNTSTKHMQAINSAKRLNKLTPRMKASEEANAQLVALSLARTTIPASATDTSIPIAAHLTHLQCCATVNKKSLAIKNENT